MVLEPMNNMLNRARDEQYAVPQFNIINMEFTQAIVETCELERSPVILGVGEPTIKYMGMDYIVSIVKAATKGSTIPIALHLDHGDSFDIVAECILSGFSSVMIDGSQLPLDHNISLTNKVMDFARNFGVSVEAELGNIGGVEDDIHINNSSMYLPTPEEAIHFWNATKVDAFALAIGTSHGMYTSKPNINFDTLFKVSSNIPVPLVLHGGSGISDSDIQRTIKKGVSKINVNTENQIAFSEAVRKVVNAHDIIQDSRIFLREGRNAIREVVQSKVRLFNSNNRV